MKGIALKINTCFDKLADQAILLIWVLIIYDNVAIF